MQVFGSNAEKRKDLMKILVLIILLALPLWAQPDAQQMIQAGYKRAATAVRLKYLDGILCNRGDDFVLCNPRGQQMDLGAERQRFQALLSNATRAGLRTKILEFHSLGAGRIGCLIEQELLVEIYNQRSHQLEVTDIRTQSEDVWAKVGNGWKIQACRVLSQSTLPGEALPKRYMRSRQEL